MIRKNKKIKIVFTGGGTIGHLGPILAIKEGLEALDKNQQLLFYYIGPKDEYTRKLFGNQNIVIKEIITGKIRRYFSFANFLDLFKIPIGILQSFWHLFVLFPDLVFSKGGYGSFPVTLAARILHIPIFLHESDAISGLANRIEGKWAIEIFTSFEKTEKLPQEKIICVGNPIRKEFLVKEEKGLEKVFGFSKTRPLILILGGSQGSEKINNTILDIIEDLTQEFEIIHQTGQNNYEKVRLEAEVVLSKEQKKYYHIYPFLDTEQLKEALLAADLVISRAGAGAIFEIAALGKPSILIPLSSSAQNHQLKNAILYEKYKGAEIVTEMNLKPHFLLERIRHLISSPRLLESMARNALSFARPEAAKIIASYIYDYLNFL
jgi:UDP-N-acetylglucosamine--N-acetylmuramyl-(pentapeptide) pyrophosphoryl-undecaprenol N-acetylglucosamine transferase